MDKQIVLGFKKGINIVSVFILLFALLPMGDGSSPLIDAITFSFGNSMSSDGYVDYTFTIGVAFVLWGSIFSLIALLLSRKFNMNQSIVYFMLFLRTVGFFIILYAISLSHEIYL
jgi:voltage-gated potassium channel Kch